MLPASTKGVLDFVRLDGYTDPFGIVREIEFWIYEQVVYA